ncbi:MAG: ATP-binding cassette domain-containing protein [Ruminococcaceae bacterium]|nr:ATP-binding cassette domain-containing protein [Oscillospiraceae bacterium]
MENKKVLLSVKDLHVKFRVRGRILTAIRGISLDFYENESVAIVGESGSGKSVFTKTFAGMLDGNGYIDQGSIIFNDPDLADTSVAYTNHAKQVVADYTKKLNDYAKYELGAATYREMEALKAERKARSGLTTEEREALTVKIEDLSFRRTELFNQRQTVDSKQEKDRYKEMGAQIAQMDAEIKELRKQEAAAIAAHKASANADTAYAAEYEKKMSALKEQYAKEIAGKVTEATKTRNERIAKEIYLSVGRYSYVKRMRLLSKLLAAVKEAMMIGVDLDDEDQINAVFDKVAFRVRYLDETEEKLHGVCVLNLAKIKYGKDWNQIRGGKIATVFQDPMTSLNPIITIGKQITSVILKHQNCTEAEARERALVLMKKVGIPNAESRFDDYPFQYSGGMRQRIVIAIALSCQPKILICDEPTTALDVTIQAQILKLIKDLQKEFGYTIVFITHDLGVVANVADRVAVLYAGQVVELGTAEEVFYDPRHPYTWALLSSLPQLAQRNTKLYSITGTPPSLYNKIVGDAFAPRNPHALKLDTLKEPPMFQITETHFAKTWLLDPRAPKIEKPEVIQNIHEKLMNACNL